MRSWANFLDFVAFFSWEKRQRHLRSECFGANVLGETEGEHHCQRIPCQVVRPQGYEGGFQPKGGMCTEFWVESSKMFCSKQDKKLLEALASLASFIVFSLSISFPKKNSWFLTGSCCALAWRVDLPRRRPKVAWPRQTWRRTSGAKLCPGQICKDTYCRYTVPPEN